MRPRQHPELPLISSPGAAGEATERATDVESIKRRIRAAVGAFYQAQRLKRGARR